uniref:Uncharacterized protein n=1 Tax=uncultured Desulfobacterium sp. TaxID=201089 RepID=E1YJY4_9BACT|nr:unknown protein [uncultured Desulfobacterium sp.]
MYYIRILYESYCLSNKPMGKRMERYCFLNYKFRPVEHFGKISNQVLK